ncbi:MAG TPA: hypothetical protein VIY48_07690 [Candidatus Paceibacterota bacterium]
MVDERIEEWIKREFNRWGDYIEAVDRRCLECRKHCDEARKHCGRKGDTYEDRIRELERQAIGSNKGAKLIATCAIVSGLMGVAGNLIARLF